MYSADCFLKSKSRNALRNTSQMNRADDGIGGEARHLTALTGSGIVPLYPTQPEGVGLLLAEAECSLADVLHERGPLPEGEVRAVAFAVARSLARVHEAGLVHADVKPANLLLSCDGELWLSDFDASVPADGQKLKRATPQRVRIGVTASHSTDIIALAVTLVELATGMIIDCNVYWPQSELQRIGCSQKLSHDIAPILAQPTSTTASRIADAFALYGNRRLPAPVADTRLHDPTPTVDFMPI